VRGLVDLDRAAAQVQRHGVRWASGFHQESLMTVIEACAGGKGRIGGCS
jgi:hypothetical protein